MDKTCTPQKNAKYSQLILAVSELDEKLDSLSRDLSAQLTDNNAFVKSSIEWLMKTVKTLVDEVNRQKSPNGDGRKSIREKECITTKEAAEYLHCAVYTICYYISQGNFFAKKMGRSYMIRTSDFIAFADNL